MSALTTRGCCGAEVTTFSAACGHGGSDSGSRNLLLLFGELCEYLQDKYIRLHSTAYPLLSLLIDAVSRQLVTGGADGQVRDMEGNSFAQ